MGVSLYFFKTSTKKKVLDDIFKKYGISKKDIIKNKYGKPYIKGNRTFFSISHSKEWAVCGVSENDLGVDLQTITNTLTSTKAMFLTTKELIQYKDATKQKLTKIWAFKEAAVKLLGVGLTKRLNTFAYKKNLMINGRYIYVYERKYQNCYLAVATFKKIKTIDNVFVSQHKSF